MATPITPNTSVYLLKSPLEMDNQHQLNFSNTTAQRNYFQSLPKIEFENFSYQRQDGVLRIEAHIDSIREYNYVMYQNDNYSNKWFYAFITGMEYANDQCTFVSIKTDVWQTYQFDLTWKRCFVEREHVNNDTFGLHTLEENIPSGEWFNNGTEQIEMTNPKNCVVAVLLSEVFGGLANNYGNRKRIYNGIPSGCYLIFVDIDSTSGSSGYAGLNDLIQFYDTYGKADAILSMYLIPRSLIADAYDEVSIQLDSTHSIDCFIPTPSSGTKLVSTTSVSRNNTLNGYTPKNNKCFTKQFNYLMITNNAGSNAIFNWEDFSGTPEFKLLATFVQGCPTKLVPTNYKGNDEPSGNIYSLSGCPFPVVCWSSDYYLNYQAKQGWTGFLQRAGDVAEFSYTSGKDNPAETLAKFVETAGMYIGQEISAITGTISGATAQAERVPAQIKGNPINNDFTFSINKCKFTLYKMSVRAEVARVVDNYFSAYGYKVATWKVPNITGRQNWNFVKLNQANVNANIPQTDLEEIKTLFLKGITIWHNPSTFLDYSQTNNIV